MTKKPHHTRRPRHHRRSARQMGVTARHTGVAGHGRATISLQEALAIGEPVTMANYASYMMG